MEFCKSFNAATKDKGGMIIPVVISVYEDKSFTFIMKSPPCSALLKQACGLAKGSGQPNKQKVGKITKSQVREIVKIKAKDLNVSDEEQTIRIVEGTARSMGIEVSD